MISKELKTLVKDEIKQELDTREANNQIRVKFFIGGLLFFILSIVSIGLLGGADILRVLHNKAFPTDTASHISISYAEVLELRVGNEGRSESRSVAFYANPKQKVKVYAKLIHRFTGTKEKRRVIITVDDQQINENPLSEFSGGFHDISQFISQETRFNREPNVHQIVFTLDDSQPNDLPDEIIIICMILVYGNTK